MSGRQPLAPNAKCSVCNDEASGFHYGVDSCEGCKGFFRRCITQGINFRCSNQEKCPITPFTRNSCQYCRLKKCFRVGMSREASRLGRRPKKTLKSSTVSNKELQAEISQHLNPHPTRLLSNDCQQQQMSLDYPSLARATLSEMFGCPPEAMQKLNGMSSAFAATPSSVHTDEPTPMSAPRDEALDCSMSTMTVSGEGNSNPITHTDLNEWRKKQFAVMSKYMHTAKDGLMCHGAAMDVSAAGELAEKGSDSKDTVTSTSAVSESLQALLDSNITIVTDDQMRKIAQFVEYTEQKVDSSLSSIRSEVQQAIIDSHMEHCYHLRSRINAVSAELDAKEQSGKDVKPPGGFWAHWMSELLPTIERVIRFLKDIPGFRELPINDQIVLIRKGAFSIVLSQAMPMVDPYHMTILDPQLKYRNTRKDFDAMPAPFQKLFDDQFILSMEFRNSGITDEETALLNAVLAVASGVSHCENSRAAGKLECLFVQTLHDYITTTFSDQPDRFQNILMLIPIIENTSQAHSTSLNNIRYNPPSSIGPISFPRLHQEIWTSDDS